MCVDGFLFLVEFPEVGDECCGLGSGFGGRGIELGVCEGGFDDGLRGSLAVVEGESFNALVEMGGVGG